MDYEKKKIMEMALSADDSCCTGNGCACDDTFLYISFGGGPIKRTCKKMKQLLFLCIRQESDWLEKSKKLLVLF